MTYTQDYADHSSYLRRYMRQAARSSHRRWNCRRPVEEAVRAFRLKHNPDDRHPVIGMAARFATEKGVEVLLNALPRILEQYPNALVQFAGPYQNIMGEETISRRLMPTIADFQASGQLEFLGSLNPAPDGSLLPEPGCAGAAQFELDRGVWPGADRGDDEWRALVASNLPGVRQPVKRA